MDKSENNLEANVQQYVQPASVAPIPDAAALAVRKHGPGTDSWYRDTLGLSPHALDLQLPLPENATLPERERSLRMAVRELKHKVVNGFSKAANGVQSFFSSSPEESALKKMKKDVVDDMDVEAMEEEPLVEEAPEVMPTLDELTDGIADRISGIIAEAEEELKTTNDVLTGFIVNVAKTLHAELGREKKNWTQIDLLVRQLSVLIVHKLANNDHKTIQEELDQLQRDCDKVAQTYKGKWELCLGIFSGVLNIVGGAVGLAGGFGAFGGLADATVKTLQGVSQAFGMVGQGVGQFNGIARNANERDRAIFNYHMERDRGYKSSADASIQANRSAKNAQISQMNSALEAAYRAFLQVAS